MSLAQLITKHGYNAGYGGVTQYLSLWGSDGSWANSVTFGINSQKTPLILPGTFSNLVVTSFDTLGTGTPTAELTLFVNGVATALTATVAAGAGGSATDATHMVTVVKGDDVEMRLVSGAIQVSPGYDVSFSVEFTGSSSTLSQYGTPPLVGSVSSGVNKCAGALGNGTWVNLPAGTQLCNTYSIYPMTTGTITGYYVKDYVTPLGTSVWTGYMRLNGVLQDGSGGTVNTSATMTGSTNTMEGSFSLPVVIGDHVELVCELTVTGVSFGSHLGATVSHNAAVAGQFMWCGGNNNAIDNANTTYAWIGSFEEVTTEARASVPIGPSGLTALGNYVELNTTPGPGNTFTFVARQSGSDTSIAFTINDPDTTGSVTSTVQYAQGDTLNLSFVPASNPASNEVHWGLIASLAVSPPVPPVTATYPLRRLRRFMLPFNGNLRNFIKRLEFICQAGVGLTAGAPASPVQGSDPQMMVRISRDGGSTWDPEVWLPFGKLGDYTARAVLRSPGSYRDGVIEVTVSDPVFATLIAVDAEIEPGNV